MKHTGKPPKKSSNRTPPHAQTRSGGLARGKAQGKPGAKPARNEERKGRHARGEGAEIARDKPRGGAKGAERTSRSAGSSTERFAPKAEGRAARPPREGSKAPARGPRTDRPDARPPRESNRGFDKPRENTRHESPRSESTRPVREPRERREPRASLGPRANMFGAHAVREAWLNPKRYIHALYLSEAAEPLFAPVLEMAERKGLERPQPKILSKDDFDRLLGRDVVHQGIALSTAPLEEAFLEDILSVAANKERSVILILDQVTDPHNVGAILRSACAFGADGVVMQRRHAPELEGVLAKTASGAADHITIAYETNLSRTLETLADAGYVAIGLDEHADKSLAEIDVPAKSVLVLGAEGDGMRRLIREHCDVLVTLPTKKPINSLNVSNAAAVALYALLNG